VSVASGKDRWAVILAGGDGMRLQPLTRAISGDDRPKQFCAFQGSTTLLDQTRQRVALSVPNKYTLTVVTQTHERFYKPLFRTSARRRLLVQPANKGTTPAILLSALRIAQVSPNATVGFFPSDHHFTDESQFMAQVESAFATSPALTERITLLGIKPDKPEVAYGWIEPDDTFERPGYLSRVRRFWEKPSSSVAQRLMERGCLWNSFVMVGHVSAFLKIIERTLPGLYGLFLKIASTFDTDGEAMTLSHAYSSISPSNFSRQVLASSPHDLFVMQMPSVGWCDLGEPGRVMRALNLSNAGFRTERGNEEEVEMIASAKRELQVSSPEIPSVGNSFPLGASVLPGGVNFSAFSKHATEIDLLLFDTVDDAIPQRVITLDPVTNHTYHYWHVFVPGLQPGQIYGYRVRGPFEPARGLRFDPQKVLLDPYGRAVVVPKNYNREAAAVEGDNSSTAMKNVVIDPREYDWEGDAPLRTPSSRTIIYEMHVRGFTKHPSSGVAPNKRGTYAGLIEKIPYLKELGITAVELLPVAQFDVQDVPKGLVNYWGYQPVAYFAPHQAYSSRQDPTGPVDEFRDMVKALHKANIEVILDVVFNHTGEGSASGPTLCFRGFDNPTYYILEADQSRYANYSGCGNSLNANNPIVRRLILDCLRYWVEEMHVDGFRFDLASILARDSTGQPMPNPPVLWDIESDPVLAGTKLIAEAWDAGGLYQVGSFIGDSWKEWNGRFRDDVRSFLRGEENFVVPFAQRLIGSPDIYGHEEREAEQSINFVTCHDGFSLNDVVSFEQKHNEANLEENRDGANDNRTWNCGVEGPTADPKIEKLRNRQVKNFLTINGLSMGMPMILMGDEFRRTQKGNNNAYCYDNEDNWLDWKLLKKHGDVHRFLTLLNTRRSQQDDEKKQRPLTLNQLLLQANKSWHGVQVNQPDWQGWSHSIALSAELKQEDVLLHLIVNAYWESLEFELPPNGSKDPWRRWIDTGLDSPHDIVPWETAAPVSGLTYRAEPRSVVALYSRLSTNRSAKRRAISRHSAKKPNS
jgi:isoamylase